MPKKIEPKSCCGKCYDLPHRRGDVIENGRMRRMMFCPECLKTRDPLYVPTAYECFLMSGYRSPIGQCSE